MPGMLGGLLGGGGMPGGGMPMGGGPMPGGMPGGHIPGGPMPGGMPGGGPIMPQAGVPGNMGLMGSMPHMKAGGQMPIMPQSGPLEIKPGQYQGNPGMPQGSNQYGKPFQMAPKDYSIPGMNQMEPPNAPFQKIIDANPQQPRPGVELSKNTESKFNINPMVQKSMSSFGIATPEFPAPLQQGTSPLQPQGSSSISPGTIAAKYEVDGKGPGYISKGSSWGDPGGDSYGSYQIETKKGTMSEYLKSGDDYAKQLSQYTPGSKQFNQTWKSLATQDPKGFEQSQFNFLANKPNGYNDALNWAQKNGWATDNPAMQNAIYSTANQSGGWKNGIFKQAGIEPGDDVKTQINKLYDARANYFRNIKLPSDVKENIIKARTVQERGDVLNMIGI